MSQGRRTAFVITIDTEADDEWSRPEQPTYAGVAALARLQELCGRYGAEPTYLVTYDVAADGASRSTLRALHEAGDCEIGAHLHAWRTPPFEHALDKMEGKHPYLHEYPPALRRAKLERLTAYLEESFGVRPRSYRGGRWSLDEVTIDELARLGYVADTTVTPYTTWERHRGGLAGGVSFMFEPPWPHVLQARDGDQSALVEVPVTVRVRGRMSADRYARLAALPGRSWAAWILIKRMMWHAGLGRAVWLDPVKSSAEDMSWLVDVAREGSEGVLNMMFHSSELVPGGAPRVRTRRAAERVWGRLEATLAYAAERGGVEFMGMAALAGRLEASGEGVGPATSGAGQQSH